MTPPLHVVALLILAPPLVQLSSKLGVASYESSFTPVMKSHGRLGCSGRCQGVLELRQKAVGRASSSPP